MVKFLAGSTQDRLFQGCLQSVPVAYDEIFVAIFWSISLDETVECFIGYFRCLFQVSYTQRLYDSISELI